MAPAHPSGIRLWGFPLSVDPGLLVVLLVIATSARAPMRLVAVVVVGAALSILAHELGHAWAARGLGADGVRIRLTSWGGYTEYRMSAATRWQSVVVALAGPAVGVILGAGVAAARAVAPPEPFTVAYIAYNTACSWARAGQAEHAWGTLDRALTYGWTDWAQITGDDDLAEVRALHGYDEWARRRRTADTG